jgi:ApaG protein
MTDKMVDARIDITVQTQYIEQQSDPDATRFAFAYTITIQNNSDRWCQLLNRHWIITDATGNTEEVQGEGVVGEQPKLNPGQGFRYTSGTILQTPVGSMQGTYEFQEADGTLFDVSITAFSLSQPNLVH